MNNHEEYRKQVQLLLRIMPEVYKIPDFAVHGGTAINLFHRNMPRYSVDIDITYIPLAGRDESLNAINQHLVQLKKSIELTIPGIRIVHKSDVWKLLCLYQGVSVKIEVNGTKRGIIGLIEDKPLCEAAQQEFQAFTQCRTVSFGQLYGGKVSAALSRQHPRDLFDCKYLMSDTPFEKIRDGLLLCLAGSDKPIVESLQPNLVDQREALDKQFIGMAEESFSYDDYLSARTTLHQYVMEGLEERDKLFLLSFEQGEPNWTLCNAGDLGDYPSVRWKLLNLAKLKKQNPDKLRQEVDKLHVCFNL